MHRKKEKADVETRKKQVDRAERKKERADECAFKVQARQQKTSQRAILNANKSKNTRKRLGVKSMKVVKE